MAGRLALIAGATSESGLVAARTLVKAGARVVALGCDPDRFDALRSLNGRREADQPVRLEVRDLTDEAGRTPG